MPIVTSSAPNSIIVPALGKVLEPGVAYEVSDSEAAEVANHPWLTVSTTAVPETAIPEAPQHESEI